MEYQVLDEKTTKQSSLCLDNEGVQNLKEGRGWALFLAILGLIGMGFLVVAAIVSFIAGAFVSSNSPLPMGLLGVVYLVLAGVYIIPLIYLLRFTSAVSRACNQNDNTAFNLAIKNLRMHFKSMGIIVIVMVVVYIIVIIGVVAFGVSRGF